MVKLNKIYTRTGDDGTTGLVDGSRLPKYAARMEAIGAVDEANSAIGLAVVALAGDSSLPSPAGKGRGWGLHAGAEPPPQPLPSGEGLCSFQSMQATLTRVQNDLFDLGADLATPGEDFTPSEMVLRIVPAQAEWIEHQIDSLNADLPPLTSFILPGGSEAAARVHVARASVRRAERAMVALAAESPVNPAALAYVNRLSDYLFVLTRAVNAAGAGDVLWVPGGNR